VPISILRVTDSSQVGLAFESLKGWANYKRFHINTLFDVAESCISYPQPGFIFRCHPTLEGPTSEKVLVSLRHAGRRLPRSRDSRSFIGGGNTFRLLKALYDFDLVLAIRRRAMAGMPYIGSSAGSNVACPTIKTINDMPIVQPPSFDALGLITFQINPHYLDPDPNSTHMGETRDERIRQFLEEDTTPVVGLREGAMLRVEEGSIELKGLSGARVFRRAHEPLEIKPGAQLNNLISPAA
jgi:dipeptidase E